MSAQSIQIKNDTTKRRSILNLDSILRRRPTKVEPSKESDVINPKINRSTSVSFAANEISNSQYEQPSKKTHKSKSFTNLNQFSGPFRLCCRNYQEPSMTPPIRVRFESKQGSQLIQVDETISIASDSRSYSENINQVHTAVVHQIASIESQVQSDPETPKESYFNHHSIALSACHSRFRERFLPPNKLDNTANTNRESMSADGSCYRRNSIPTVLIDSDDPNEILYDETKSTGQNRKGRIRKSPSTNSLACHSLVAAQVLNLLPNIPIEKARERSYAVGSLTTDSLMGAKELDRMIPSRRLNIFVGTWNMNGQSPPKQMNEFILPTSIDNVPDLIAIGTQESFSERNEWEVSLQETLGPTHILFHAASLGTLHLAIFLRRDLIWYCSVPEEDSLSVRPGTAFRTKGAVAISFCIFGTSMLFVTSHLTAHQQKLKERVQDVKRIIHALDLPKNLHSRTKVKDVTQNFDTVFWCGDLNFRLSEPREIVLKWIEETKFPLPSHMPHGCLHTDQLTSVLSDGAAFTGFEEAPITFPPTYKYDPGTQHFDTSSKQRAPAYTDRILFKYRAVPSFLRRASMMNAFANCSPVECITYDSVPSITTSDHKPVWALFKVTIRPGIDSIPLAAGLFNREVYLEGMKRRLRSTTRDSSTVCTIQ